MKDHFIKKLVLIFVLLATPVSVCFADAAMDAKIAEVKARVARDFAPPKAAQYLTANNRNAASQSMDSGRPLNNTSSQNSSLPTDNSAPTTESAAPKSSGSWYIQPGDSGTGSSGASGSSFDHNNLY